MTHIRRRSAPGGQVFNGHATGGPAHKLAWPDLGGIRCPDCRQILNRKSTNGQLGCRHCGGRFTFSQVQQSIQTRGAATDRKAEAQRDDRHRVHMATLEGLADSERNQPGYVGAVYYIRFRDAIKIGTSTNVGYRLKELPWEEVMALEPGGLAVEHLRHVQMKAHRLVGEWFEMTDEVHDLIESVRSANVQWMLDTHPHITNLPSPHAATRFGV